MTRTTHVQTVATYLRHNPVRLQVPGGSVDEPGREQPCDAGTPANCAKHPADAAASVHQAQPEQPHHQEHEDTAHGVPGPPQPSLTGEHFATFSNSIKFAND